MSYIMSADILLSHFLSCAEHKLCSMRLWCGGGDGDGYCAKLLFSFQFFFFYTKIVYDTIYEYISDIYGYIQVCTVHKSANIMFKCVHHTSLTGGAELLSLALSSSTLFFFFCNAPKLV